MQGIKEMQLRFSHTLIPPPLFPNPPTCHESPYLLQCVGYVRLHLGLLLKDQTGQQGGALLRGQGTQGVLKQ